MSKAASYFDWEIDFRNKNSKEEKTRKSEERSSENYGKLNSVGISESEFKEFMKEWKKKNL